MFYRELVTNRGLSLPLFGDHQDFRFFFTWLYIDSCSFLTSIIPTKRKLKIRCPISWLITELTLLWTKKTFCFEEHLKFVNGIVCKLPVKFVISNKIISFQGYPNWFLSSWSWLFFSFSWALKVIWVLGFPFQYQ